VRAIGPGHPHGRATTATAAHATESRHFTRLAVSPSKIRHAGNGQEVEGVGAPATVISSHDQVGRVVLASVRSLSGGQTIDVPDRHLTSSVSIPMT